MYIRGVITVGTASSVLGGIGRYWAVLGGIGRYWAVLGGIGRYWAVLGGIGRYWAVLGGIGRYWAVYIWRYIFGGIYLAVYYIYRRFREKVTWGCKMNLYELHFISSIR